MSCDVDESATDAPAKAEQRPRLQPPRLETQLHGEWCGSFPIQRAQNSGELLAIVFGDASENIGDPKRIAGRKAEKRTRASVQFNESGARIGSEGAHSSIHH